MPLDSNHPFTLAIACGFGPALKGYLRMSRLEHAWTDSMTGENIKRYLRPASYLKVRTYNFKEAFSDVAILAQASLLSIMLSQGYL